MAIKVDQVHHKPAQDAKQRDHQANGRTFLAWLRTSISLISLGLAINKFSIYLNRLSGEAERRSSHPIIDTQDVGLLMVSFGMLMILWSAIRYSRVTSEINQGTFRPNLAMIWTFTGLVFLIRSASLYLLFRR
jgi:putative membrane protein